MLLTALLVSLIFPPVIDIKNASADSDPTPVLTIASSDIVTPAVLSTATGTFSSSSSTFTVSTTNATGYNLTIQAKVDDSDYSKLLGTSSSLNSIGSAITEYDFKTSSNYNNQWGYRPNMLNGSANTSYLPAPTFAGSTLDTTSSANATATTYTIDLGVRITNTTTPDDYSNTFVITAVANANRNLMVNYLPNTGETAMLYADPADFAILAHAELDAPLLGNEEEIVLEENSQNEETADKPENVDESEELEKENEEPMPDVTTTPVDIVTNLPNSFTVNTFAPTISLSPLVPIRADYKFIGWCDITTTSTAVADACPGKVYQAGDELELEDTMADVLNLYAMWEHVADIECNAEAASITEAACLQDVNQSVINSMPSDISFILSDSRDGKHYTISRLSEDGQLWMTKDLSLDLNSNMVYTNTSSDLGWGVQETENTEWAPAISTVHLSDTIATWDTDIAAPFSLDPDDDSGNYYNRAAAFATNYYDDAATYTTSICPSGWRLPDISSLTLSPSFYSDNLIYNGMLIKIRCISRFAYVATD